MGEITVNSRREQIKTVVTGEASPWESVAQRKGLWKEEVLPWGLESVEARCDTRLNIFHGSSDTPSIIVFGK